MGRIIGILMAVIALAACAPAAAPTAQSSADCAKIADRGAKYLCWLRVYDFRVDGETQQSLIIAGSTLCESLRKGGTPDEGVAVLYRVVPNISEKQAGNLISAAQFGLCPETL